MTVGGVGGSLEPACGHAWRREAGLLLLIVIGPMLLHLWLAAVIPLAEDEAYYRLWALAPASSYYDHPPMVAWMMAGGRWLIGDTALGLRFMGVMATVISTVALWRIAQLLIGRELALLAVGFAAVMPLLSVGAIVITPDTPSVLFFVLGAWALAELQESRNANWWLAVGLFAGLGLLSKYTNFFLGISIVAWLLATRQNWQWFRRWQLYAGGALALAIFAPVILWNVEHGGASFAKQFGRVGDVDGFRLVWTLELWGALLLLAGPVVLWLAGQGLWQTVRTFRATGSTAGALLLALTLPLIVYFGLHALHGRVLPNWLAPVYPFIAVLAAAGAGAISEAVARRRAVVSGLAVSAVLSLLIYAYAATPFYVAAHAKEPTQQLRGWTEFAAGVSDIAKAEGAAYIATTSYGTAGQIAFHLDERWPVLQLNDRIRYVHLPTPPADLFAKAGLVVELARRDPRALLDARFQEVKPLGTLTRGYNGVPLQTYVVYRVARPVGDVLRLKDQR